MEKNIEIEKKYQVKNFNLVEPALQKEGFEKCAEERQIDVPISQVYHELINAWPRVRYSPKTKKTVVTIKGKKYAENLKPVRAEIEFETADFEKSIEFFELMGFFPMGKVDKMRKIYKKGPVEVALDTINGNRHFVEIEVKINNPKEGLKLIEKHANQLGLFNEINEGYFDLINKSTKKVFTATYNTLNETSTAKILLGATTSIIRGNILCVSGKNGSYYAGFQGKKIILTKDNCLKLIN